MKSKTAKEDPVSVYFYSTLKYPEIRETEKKEQLCFEFPHYFAYFFNSLFYIFPVPFKIRFFNNSEQVLKSHKLHTALCVCFHLIAFIAAVLGFLPQIAPHLKHSPQYC